MIVTLIIGFVIGVLAKFIYPGRDKLGIIMTTLLGIGGSVLGSWAGFGLVRAGRTGRLDCLHRGRRCHSRRLQPPRCPLRQQKAV